ncbi:MAG: FAD-binding oxidoreductase [Candidatus Hermodarchaeota archaeon]
MRDKNLVKSLQESLPWNDFLDALESSGFKRFHSIDTIKLSSDLQYKKMITSGSAIIVNSKVLSLGLKDPSLLSLSPYMLFRPITESQLKSIIVQAQKFKIPITFAAGKTGLSGGFANYAAIIDLSVLHSLDYPYEIDLKKEVINVEQGVLVSDLIKLVPIRTNKEFIFPVQPASALKLPVRVGGLISSNASGVTSGKLGAAEDWIETLRIMLPNGEIIEIGRESPFFHKIVGGNGYFAVVLNATFRLYKPEKELKYKIIYGYNLDSAFNGLQNVLEHKIFPLISEFVSSPLKLPGIFNDLNINDKTSEIVKWAVMLKGSPSEVTSFAEIMNNESECLMKDLSEEAFQDYLQERSAFALLVQTTDKDSDFIAFPGFEDILSPPKFLPEIIRTINSIFKDKDFHEVIFGYGHINFRKGKGLLLHMRLPVPIEYLYKENEVKKALICETVYNVITTLKEKYGIQPKAEHSPGIYKILLDYKFRNQLRHDIIQNQAFYNPHLIIFDNVAKKIQEANANSERVPYLVNQNLTKDVEKQVVVSFMLNYI